MPYETSSTSDQDKGQSLKPPLSSSRDTGRSILNSNSKLATSVPSWTNGAVSANTPNGNDNLSSSSAKKGSTSKTEYSRSAADVVTPAYAYKNPKSKLLEITNFHPPTPSNLSSSNSLIYPIVKNGGGIYSNSREYYESTKKTALFAGFDGDYDEGKNKENITGESNIPKPDQAEKSVKDRSMSLWEQWIKERDQHLIKSEKGKKAVVSFMDDNGFGGSNVTSSSDVSYNEDDFDFALVLKPNAEYSFWADRLDFRPEAGVISYSGLLNIKPRSDEVQLEHSNPNKSISPVNQTDMDYVRALFSAKKCVRKSVFDLAMDITTPPRINALSRRSGKSRILQKLGSSSSLRNSRIGVDRENLTPFDSKKKGTPSSTQRRRWGNPTLYRESSKSDLRRPDLTSPPIVSYKKNTVSRHDPATTSKKRKATFNNYGQIDFELLKNLPPQVIPRGISKRNELSIFLDALKIGIVVRRHKPNTLAQYVKIFTDDGGDAIHFQYILPEEAKVALKEQGVRYKNKRLKLVDDIAGLRENHETSTIQGQVSTVNSNKIDLPDYVAARYFREEQSKLGGISKALHNFAIKMSFSGCVLAGEIMEIHPANKSDPFNKNINGTVSIRASKSSYSESKTFSLVLYPQRISRVMTSEPMKTKFVDQWYSPKKGSSPKNYRYIDFETETDEEYWLISRGFLLLQREASKGRFARQRAMGVSSYVNKLEMEIQRENRRREEQSKREEEEANAGGSLKLALSKITRTLGLGKQAGSRDVSGGFQSNELSASKNVPNFRPAFDRFAECTLPPPSDFFLGFGSSGTQIWSRLRQAGLETQRIYALDKQCVMIRVRCPKDRLYDVAEVLRLKLRTKNGSYEPFSEENVDQFERSSDSMKDSPFGDLRSSYRQTIIDFIIRSRIRDSGAELGENTKLGKEISMRVPLHMPKTLARLYGAWVTFWFEENWKGRDGKSMSVIPSIQNVTVCSHPSFGRPSSPLFSSGTAILDGRRNAAHLGKPDHLPHIIIRFVMGSFYQPLDSIQQYFGERVAFYFAWQQHCAAHLIFLSVIGIAVCIVLVRSGSWDHPIRPAFSFIIMIWSFVVMVTWRQRQTYLAHRWGTLNYQEEETTRPQHFGTYRQCPITKEWTIHYPIWKRWIKYVVSISVVFMITAGTLYVVMVIFSNRDNFLCMYEVENKNMSDAKIQFNLFELLYNSSCKKLNSTISDTSQIRLNGPNGATSPIRLDFDYWWIKVKFPVILALGLPLLNFALMRLAIALTEFENYRTESEYQNQLIIKVFTFRFVCYFASLYWYSFRKVPESLSLLPQSIELAAIITDTISTVAFMLMVSLTVSHWWNLLLTIFIPQWFHRWRLYEHQKKIINEIRLIQEIQEENFKLQEEGIAQVESRDIKLVNSEILLRQAQSNVWQEAMLPEHISFHDYVYVVIQFAFVTCFSVMLPIAPFISLLNHLWGIRLDAYKLCKGRRRPIVQRAGGIGVWEHVLHVVTVVGVVTNCALTAFTNKLFQNIRRGSGMEDRILLLVIVVVAWEHFMLLVKYAMQALINPVPKSVIFSLKKDKYERDVKASRDVRRKKHSKSRNSKKRESAINCDEYSVQKRVDIPSIDTEPEGNSKEIFFQVHLMQAIQPKPIQLSHQKNEVDRSSSNGLAFQNEIVMPPPDSHVTINIEPESEQIEQIDVVPSAKQKSLVSSRNFLGSRSPLRSVGISNIWSGKGFHLDQKVVSPTRNSIPARSAKFLTSPRNNLRRRVASTSTCDIAFDKEDSFDRGELKADDALFTHEDDVHLPTPRRLRLEDPNCGKAVTELRKLFEHKSS